MKVRKQFVRESLKNWLALNERLLKLSEEEVLFALELENESESPRATFVKRLAQRYNAIQSAKLREEFNDRLMKKELH